MMARSRDYHGEYLARLARGEALGLSKSASRGHPRAGEPSARDIREAARHPDAASIEALQNAALANARAVWRGGETTRGPWGPADEQRLLQRLRQMDDRETLNTVRRASREEWQRNAAEAQANGIRNSIWYYH
jgi:hypothetical protein